MSIGFKYCKRTIIVTNSIGIDKNTAHFLARHQDKIAMVYISVHDNLDICIGKADSLSERGFPRSKIMFKIMTPPLPKKYQYIYWPTLHHWTFDRKPSFVSGCAHPSMSFIKGKIVVDSAGDIHVCCLSWKKIYLLGNLFKQSLKEIWEKRARDFLSYYSSPQNQPEDFPCRTCHYAMRKTLSRNLLSKREKGARIFNEEKTK
ncbi:MAG: SPASM domain-containing protein [Candidatus Omnitrophota bacterium]